MTGTALAVGRRRHAGPRLVRLHLTSRQVPGGLALLAGCAVLLRVALHLHWMPDDGAAARQTLLLIECAAASVVAVAARTPFGESERATGPRLPVLRLAASLLLTAAAAGSLALGAAAARVPGGALGLLRDVPGLAGIGLIAAAALGGALAWTGPLAYTVLAELALMDGWRTPWTWPARPAHDAGAWWCAALAFAAGTALVAARGPRDTGGDG
ncbi:hypothetical protein SAMN05216267_1010172 [Actinacidiphila rubida]|uniref:Uncharacterized protein n=1 Tax=Actinacidiphila rubida TaxID=310780 RepID=A0A1H8JK92_9ACTN|nr:hypothetical protein [Actinacidiphila rubida]SEN81204.1 hypothetical protein SAMN05216267_1010172 [Actinacidiphila rubida]